MGPNGIAVAAAPAPFKKPRREIRSDINGLLMMRFTNSSLVCRRTRVLLSREIFSSSRSASGIISPIARAFALSRTKYELIESLPAGGTAVLNGDDEYVSQFELPGCNTFEPSTASKGLLQSVHPHDWVGLFK
jgi:hypothetical protein